MAEKAASRYKQVRLTVTEEEGGWVTARVMAKPLDASWAMHNTVWHHRFHPIAPTPHWLDLLAHVYAHLGMEDMGSLE